MKLKLISWVSATLVSTVMMVGSAHWVHASPSAGSCQIHVVPSESLITLMNTYIAEGQDTETLIRSVTDHLSNSTSSACSYHNDQYGKYCAGTCPTGNSGPLCCAAITPNNPQAGCSCQD